MKYLKADSLLMCFLNYLTLNLLFIPNLKFVIYYFYSNHFIQFLFAYIYFCFKGSQFIFEKLILIYHFELIHRMKKPQGYCYQLIPFSY